MTDSQLLAEFARSRSESAFAEIVRRHGRMVLGVCLRVTGRRELAEEAAQAAFMVLARKAGKPAWKSDVGAWLHRVARDLARSSVRAEGRRVAREREVAAMQGKPASPEDTDRRAELLGLIDAEVVRLPARLREVVVGLYLEGSTQAELASRMGVPEGTVASRSRTALERLRRLLSRRGLVLGSAALSSQLAAAGAAAVDLPASFASLPALAAAFAGGGSAAQAAAATGAAGSKGGAWSLAEGAMDMMYWTKVKIATAVLCVAAAVGVGTPFAYRALAAGTGGNGNRTAKTDTALGRLAASLKPGEMKKLNTIGLNRNLCKSWYDWDTIENGVRKYGAQHMFSIMGGGWANDAKWDPQTEQVFFLAGGHYAAFKFVTYSAKTNKWTLEPVPPWLDPRSKSQDCGRWPKSKAGNKVWPRGHTYDCNAIYPGKRRYALTLWGKLRLYDVDKKKWLKCIPGFNTNSKGPCEGFPELGGFVAFSRSGKLIVYDPDKGSKRELGGVPYGIHGVMEYNPVHKVLIVGGGDSGKDGTRGLALVDAKGRIKRLKPLPVRVNCTPTSKLMCDPVSGEYIFQEVHQRNMKRKQKVYALHPILNEWKEMKRRFPTGVAVAVDTYGVIVILTDGMVYVYKHKSPWPDAVPGKGEAK